MAELKQKRKLFSHCVSHYWFCPFHSFCGGGSLSFPAHIVFRQLLLPQTQKDSRFLLFTTLIWLISPSVTAIPTFFFLHEIQSSILCFHATAAGRSSSSKKEQKSFFFSCLRISGLGFPRSQDNEINILRFVLFSNFVPFVCQQATEHCLMD